MRVRKAANNFIFLRLELMINIFYIWWHVSRLWANNERCLNLPKCTNCTCLWVWLFVCMIMLPHFLERFFNPMRYTGIYIHCVQSGKPTTAVVRLAPLGQPMSLFPVWPLHAQKSKQDSRWKLWLYLPFSDWFGTKRSPVRLKIDRLMVNTIWFRLSEILASPEKQKPPRCGAAWHHTEGSSFQNQPIIGE